MTSYKMKDIYLLQVAISYLFNFGIISLIQYETFTNSLACQARIYIYFQITTSNEFFKNKNLISLPHMTIL